MSTEAIVCQVNANLALNLVPENYALENKTTKILFQLINNSRICLQLVLLQMLRNKPKTPTSAQMAPSQSTDVLSLQDKDGHQVLVFILQIKLLNQRQLWTRGHPCSSSLWETAEVHRAWSRQTLLTIWKKSYFKLGRPILSQTTTERFSSTVSMDLLPSNIVTSSSKKLKICKMKTQPFSRRSEPLLPASPAFLKFMSSAKFCTMLKLQVL